MKRSAFGTRSFPRSATNTPSTRPMAPTTAWTVVTPYAACPSFAGSSGATYSTKCETIQASTSAAFRMTAMVCTQRCASYCFLTASRQPTVNISAATSMTTSDRLAPNGVATPTSTAPCSRSAITPPCRRSPSLVGRDPTAEGGPTASQRCVVSSCFASHPVSAVTLTRRAARSNVGAFALRRRPRRGLGWRTLNGERCRRNGYGARNATMSRAPTRATRAGGGHDGRARRTYS